MASRTVATIGGGNESLHSRAFPSPTCAGRGDRPVSSFVPAVAGLAALDAAVAALVLVAVLAGVVIGHEYHLAHSRLHTACSAGPEFAGDGVRERAYMVSLMPRRMSHTLAGHAVANPRIMPSCIMNQ